MSIAVVVQWYVDSSGRNMQSFMVGPAHAQNTVWILWYGDHNRSSAPSFAGTLSSANLTVHFRVQSWSRHFLLQLSIALACQIILFVVGSHFPTSCVVTIVELIVLTKAHYCDWHLMGLKGALSRYSVILCRFFAVENGGEKTRGRDAGQRVAGPAPFFSFLLQQGSSELCNRLTSESQSVAHVKWFFYRTKVRLWELIKNVRTKRRGCLVMAGINNCVKCLESETGLHSSTDQSWAVLVRRSSLMIFQVQLCDFATQYNVHCGKR